MAGWQRLGKPERTGRNLRRLICFLILLFLLAIGGIVFLWYENSTFGITEYELSLGLKTSVKIVQISDLHGKEFGEENEKLIASVREQDPDLIAVTGDLVSRDGKNREKMYRLMQTLSKDYPVYYILGNHETESEYQEEILTGVAEAGGTVLQNEIAALKVGEETVNLLGLQEWPDEVQNYVGASISGQSDSNYHRLFSEFEQMDGVKILLSHFPEYFSYYESMRYDRLDIDLQLSGHAHGGQIRLPVIGGLYAPDQGFFPKYTEGVWGNRPYLVISRGLGGYDWLPRIFNRPELVTVTLN